MNRIDRLHAILTHLQSKKRVTAQKIADRFGISLRTVYRDVKALEETGVPVIGEAGSGYSIMEGYRLPPVMFTQEEAAALLLGAKLTNQLTDRSIQKHYNDALYKIKAVLRGADKDHVEILETNITISPRKTDNDTNDTPHLAALQKAIAEKKLLFLKYQSNYNNNQVSERQVEPVGLWHYSQSWHLIGWCRLRNNYRDFNVNRILRLQLKDEIVTPRSYQSLQDYIKNLPNGNMPLYEAVVLFDRELIPLIVNLKYNFGFIRQEEAGSKIRVFFLTPYLEILARWLLGFTNGVTVESPALLKTILHDLVEEITIHYNNTLASHGRKANMQK